MPHTPDLVIRGGTIVDGSGGQPYEADLAVSAGVICAIGGDIPAGKEEIDAKGRIVTPDFVDVHTHYRDATDCRRPAAPAHAQRFPPNT